MRRSALLLLAAALSAPGPARADEAFPGLARLEAAAASHPDDPDLAWALARGLRDAGRTADAARALEAFVARWPGLRPDADLVLGGWLLDLDRPADALPFLERAVARAPESGPARLELGLALRREGRLDEARAELERAGHLERELRDDAMLLRALTLLDQGDEAGGRRLLRRTIDLEPEGEPARSARLVLGERARPRGPLFDFEAVGGVEYDSNVVLDGGSDLSTLVGDEADARFTWAAVLTGRPVSDERFDLALGYRYDQAAHLELHDYDTSGHTGFASARFFATPRLGIGLDGLVGFAELASDPYVLTGLVRPSAFVSLGPRAGLLRLYAESEWLDYEDAPPLPSLDRDGIRVGGGIEHALAVPGREGAWLSLGAGWHRTDTDAGRDDLGFAGAYDCDRYRGSARVHVPLAWRASADGAFAFSYERYRHRNVIGFLEGAVGGGSLDPEAADRRRDLVSELEIRLSRPVTRFATAEITYRFLDRTSNVELYDYDRHIAGLAVRIHPFRTPGGARGEDR